ncbi:MAG: lytic transglycosylase domain-containing protein [Deltaproteobacteria bacterium]|nr:lytic transglycosylase domain-containing protein [Deltaproteobacteria bacterium]
MNRKRLLRIFVLGLFTLGSGFSAWAVPKTIALPVTLDYPLIRSFLVTQVYTQPGQKAVLLDQNNHCVRIELSDPRVNAKGSLIHLLSKIKLQAGLELGNRCLQPLVWEGYWEVRLQPYLDQKTRSLRFKTRDSKFYNQQLEKMTVVEVIWKMIKKYVHPPLDRVAIDLGPPINEVTQLLPFFVKPENQEKFERGLRSLRTGKVRVGPNAVEAEILFDLEVPEAVESGKAPVPLTEEEKVRFIKTWEIWDSFLVHELLSLIGRPLSEEEKGTLLKTLLEMRYGFVDALDHRKSEGDLVREQFIKSWNELGPILRKTLIQEDAPSLFGYMAYFTAMDSLKILDHLGGSFGLEISQNGLIRLARLLSRGERPWSPGYAWEVNPELRQLLGLGAPIQETGPGYEEDELELPEATAENLFFRRKSRRPIRFVSTSPPEGEKIPKAAGELMKWLPDGKNLDDYLERVEEVLQGATDQVLSKKNLEEKYHGLFRLLVSATAWQESCWRQLTASNGKVRYLCSYNGSSVGLMQINLRVWRGLYQPKSLRWNIHYNVLAGTEILELYFRRWALNRLGPNRSLPLDILGGAVYAMYNGGPNQFERFLKRQREGRLNAFDRLFLEKYGWVKNGQMDRIQMCLGGK